MEINDKKSRKLICERFVAIEKAQRSLHPLTIQLLNESRGIVYNSLRANLAPNTITQGQNAAAN
jgi:hypothetical protein